MKPRRGASVRVVGTWFLLVRLRVSHLTVLLIENILSAGPPIESDWWEEEEESCASSSSSSLDGESDDTPPDAVGTDSASSSLPKRRVRFRNVGYLTWQRVQHNWKSSGGSLHGTQDSDLPTATRAAARPPTPSAKRELVKGLANNRHFEMKHRVRLPDLLAIYNEMWTEEWSD
jgi:hypothetical protein